MFAVFFKRTKWFQVAAGLITAMVLCASGSGWGWSRTAKERPSAPLVAAAQAVPGKQESQEVAAAAESSGGSTGDISAGMNAVDKSAGFFDFLERKHFRSEEVVATGYSAGVESTGKSPGHPEYGITYSGVKVHRGLFSTVAADPSLFPIGTILYIPGYGFGVVADTGSAIKGRKIDLYFETKRQVYDQWGKRNVRVSVLRLGSGRLSEASLRSLNERKAYLPTDSKANKS